MKLKVIHIHTDHKFIDGSKIYEGANFINEIIFIGINCQYDGYYKDSITKYRYSKIDIDKVIDICNSADILVMWELNFVKSYIINRIREDIVVIWRFFGLELYSKMPEYVYSKLTLQAKRNDRLSFNQRIRMLAGRLKCQVFYKTNSQFEFEKSINRINFFQGLSKIEYLFLSEKWSSLPVFLQNPFSQGNKGERSIQTKSNLIILGNNRSAYNNHLDILNIISNTSNHTMYRFLMLFNYGQQNRYTNIVKAKAREISSIDVIEDYMPYNKFSTLYSNVSAFVLNGYRQMAMANVFEAIRYDVKLYLNERNSIFHWLREEGFYVFSVSEFASDLKLNRINLSNSEKEHNAKQYNHLREKYTVEKFQKKILDYVLRKN